MAGRYCPKCRAAAVIAVTTAARGTRENSYEPGTAVTEKLPSTWE